MSDERRTEVISLRLSKPERDRLAELAAKAGLRVSDYLRSCVVDWGWLLAEDEGSAVVANCPTTSTGRRHNIIWHAPALQDGDTAYVRC